MEQIRVLHNVTKMDAGGIETLLMNIYRNIDRKKVQFDFLVHRQEKGFYENEIEELGGRVYRVERFNPLNQKKYINSLERFFKEHSEYKIVHAHDSFSMFTLRAAHKYNVPIRIAHSHNSKPLINLKYFFIEYCKFSLKKYSTNLFACSEIASEWLFGKEATKKDVKIINNSIDLNMFKYNESIRKEYRQLLDIENNFVIGHIGRFHKQKNHDFLLDVFKGVHEQNKKAILLLIGEGKLEDKIKDKIKKLDIEESVKLVGVVSNVYDYIQAMDIFVFPSLYEGFGNVVIEAQAAGLPCIVADTIPQQAHVTNNIISISLKENKSVWVDEILRINKSRYVRNSYDRNNRLWEYDIKSVANDLENFYINCLEKERR